jgi:sporulation protein YlmC with PRC-barrel domain
MLLNAEKLIGVKAEHDTVPLHEHKINDILFNKFDHRLCYFTYTQETGLKENEFRESPHDQHIEAVVAATSGITTQNTPMVGSAYPESMKPSFKETFFIPWHQVVEINEHKLTFKGNERQKEEPQECYSYISFKGWTVVGRDGEKIGKIKDLLMDIGRQQVVGLVVSEGVWKSMIGSGERFMPIIGTPDWSSQEWKVEQPTESFLKDKAELL